MATLIRPSPDKPTLITNSVMHNKRRYLTIETQHLTLFNSTKSDSDTDSFVRHNHLQDQQQTGLKIPNY